MPERSLPGSRVSVELGKRKAAGVVLRVGDSLPDLPATITIRQILDTVDEFPAIPPDLLDLCLWISSYYFYPPGEVFDLVIPFKGSEPVRSALNGPRMKFARLIDYAASENLKSEKSREIVRLLRLAGGTAGLRDLRKSCENSDYSLKKLVKDGIISIEESQEQIEDQFFSGVGQGGLSDEPGPVSNPCALELTEDQCAAIDEIGPFINRPGFQPFVLYGVTGSGKTEIYLRLIEKAARSGNGAIVLVPEIGISAQMESIFRGAIRKRACRVAQRSARQGAPAHMGGHSVREEEK